MTNGGGAEYRSGWSVTALEEIAVHRVVPFDITNFTVDQFRQTRFKRMNRRLWAEQLEGRPQIRYCCGADQKDSRPRNYCAAQSPHEKLMTQELEALLRIPDAARVLGIKQKTLRDWVWRRKITFIKVGKGVAFRPSDLRDFIEKNVVRRSESE